MSKQESNRGTDVPASRPSRRAQLQALLFAGAAFGTVLVTLGGAVEPKLPPFKGE
jgi:hypothetical protein